MVNISNQYFCMTLWLMTICHQTALGSKRILTSEDVVETIMLYHTNPHLDLEDSNQLFCFVVCFLHDTPSHEHRHTKFSYKGRSSSEDIFQTKPRHKQMDTVLLTDIPH